MTLDRQMDNFNFKKYLKEGKLLKEEINLDIIDDYAILTGDSGKYEGEIEDDGTVSFSVIFDKQGLDTRIIDQYDESNIDEFLGKDHAFVELSKKYDHNWDIEPDLVGITIKLTEGKLQEASRDYDFNSYYIDQIKRDLEEFGLDNEGANEYLESLARAILDLKK